MRYQFADCELDTQRYVITRLGEVTTLRPQVFQVLMYLLTHCERVVTKQELTEQVWRAVVTSDSALETGIRAVRQAVGDNGRDQRIIRTYHGHGYQFVAPVTTFSKGAAGVLSKMSEGPNSRRPDAAESIRACFSCGYASHVHDTFCIACGTRLWQYCARCGHGVALPASQCDACAWPVTNVAPSGHTAALPTASLYLEPGGSSLAISHEAWSDDGVVAVAACHQAGQEALKRAAYLEAASCFQAALGRLDTLPTSTDRKRLRLILHLSLGRALMASKGYTAPEVGANYARAQALGEEIGDIPLLFAALGGLRRFYENRGQLLQARSCGEQQLGLAQCSQDAVVLQEAHYSLGHTLYSLGEFHLAMTHLKQGAERIDPEQLDSVCFYLICQALMASCLWLMGYPDQALTQIQQVLPLARARAGPLTLMHVFFHTAQVHQWRYEPQAVQQWAEHMIALATERSLPHWLNAGMNLQGWVLTQQGRFVEGVGQLHERLKACRERNAYIACQPTLALLAETYGEVGEIDKGLSVLDERFEIAVQVDRHWREAEFSRLRGELLALQDDTCHEAEVCFHHALDVTQAQGAKSLELRAAMGLSQLWRRQGKRQAACQLLTDRYTWFTEGFETRDLQAAKALLATLA